MKSSKRKYEELNAALYKHLEKALEASIEIAAIEKDEIRFAYANVVFNLFDVMQAREDFSADDLALMTMKIGKSLLEGRHIEGQEDKIHEMH